MSVPIKISRQTKVSFGAFKWSSMRGVVKPADIITPASLASAGHSYVTKLMTCSVKDFTFSPLFPLLNVNYVRPRAPLHNVLARAYNLTLESTFMHRRALLRKLSTAHRKSGGVSAFQIVCIPLLLTRGLLMTVIRPCGNPPHNFWLNFE